MTKKCKTCAAFNESDSEKCRIGIPYVENCGQYDEMIFENGEQRAKQIIAMALKSMEEVPGERTIGKD